MKKYDVTGIGNALVDIEFKTTDQFFAENGVEKGLMTLVDEDRQNELMKVINTDEAKKQCGGSAGNTVIAVSQFGGKAFYSCKVADDELGHFYMKDMQDSGVDNNLESQSLAKGVTGKCLVMVTEDAERTMNTFLGITQTYSIADVDEEAIKNSQYLYIEGYLITSENGKSAIRHAKRVAEENGVKVAITFSDPAMVKYFKEPFIEILGEGVDMLFANEEEAMLFTGTENLDDAREGLKKVAKHFVITQGKNGAIILMAIPLSILNPMRPKRSTPTALGICLLEHLCLASPMVTAMLPAESWHPWLALRLSVNLGQGYNGMKPRIF